MSWELKETPRTYKVTPKLTEEFVEMEPAPNDRPLSERRLTIYERLLRSEQFRPCTWASAWCDETGQLYRVNGKHTSRLFAGLLAELHDKLPPVIVERYKCETLEDVARLYATFDSRVGTRTAGDLARAFAGSVPELADLRAKIIRLSVTAISYAENPLAWWIVPIADRTEEILDNVEFILWLDSILEGEKSKHLCRGPVVGAMCKTWRKSHKAATEFWLAVRDETGASPVLPDRKLARFLLTTRIGTTGGSPNTRVGRFENPIVFYVKSLHAWNAWRQGAVTDLKYFRGKIPSLK